MNDLYPHQQEGVRFLRDVRTACLADDMGLGKTRQAIHAATPPVLIVCPAIAIGVWMKELAGAGKTNYRVLDKGTSFHPPYAFWNITSYDLFRRHFKRLPRHRTIIYDEAHYLKTPTSKNARAAISHISSPCKFLLTGTPIKNNYAEYFIPAFLTVDHKRLLEYRVASYEAWQYAFCKMVTEEIYTRGGVKRMITHIAGSQNAPLLRELIGPNYLRRKKEDVLKDLPALQWSAYPVQGSAFGVYSEEEFALAEAAATFNNAPAPLAARRTEHALKKVPIAADIVREYIAATGGPIVVFGWHVDSLHSLAASLVGLRVAVIDGGTPHHVRTQIASDFQAGMHDVVIGQIIAAGTAITLTRASYCLFIDLSWSPADNRQARDRLHRIGQRKEVVAQYIVVENDPLDSRLTEVLAQKTRDIETLEHAA